jgi:hypothetical protein
MRGNSLNINQLAPLIGLDEWLSHQAAAAATCQRITAYFPPECCCFMGSGLIGV